MTESSNDIHSESRKSDHIDLATKAQLNSLERDQRFYYEPLLSAHPDMKILETKFLGKNMSAPLWISSMTGGTAIASKVNKNLARACAEYGLGMGLGSCRSLLTNDDFIGDFDLRSIIGNDLPFYANLGIAQAEQLLLTEQLEKIDILLEKLSVDGLIIHINPLQEWMQPEGDELIQSPLVTIKAMALRYPGKIIAKEVGQGMGPNTLLELQKLPLAAIEFAAFGGTNFAKLEGLRSNNKHKDATYPMALVGHTAEEMIDFVSNNKELLGTEAICQQFIISGGVKDFLHGHHLMNKLKGVCVYGQAHAFLIHAANSYEDLQSFINSQLDGLKMAKAYLTNRDH